MRQNSVTTTGLLSGKKSAQNRHSSINTVPPLESYKQGLHYIRWVKIRLSATEYTEVFKSTDERR
jgi:hypothetical protein